MTDTIEKTKTSRAPNAADLAAGEKLRKLRLGRGMTLAVLADKIGISHQQLQKYEQGSNRMSVGMLSHICEVIHVPPSHFFDGISEDAAVEKLNNIKVHGERVIGRIDAVMDELANLRITVANFIEE